MRKPSRRPRYLAALDRFTAISPAARAALELRLHWVNLAPQMGSAAEEAAYGAFDAALALVPDDEMRAYSAALDAMSADPKQAHLRG